MSTSMAHLFRIRWIFKFYENKLFSSRTKTHYENLEINPKATQGEVKSAYFKLSMQYHPDKNKSEEAKIKFRKISEAYETLGSYEKRKQYDRTIRVREPVYQKRDIKPTDITKEAHRAHMEIIRHKTQNDGTPIYNFDAWTRAHYGETFEKTRRSKAAFEMYNEMKKEKMKNLPSKSTETALIVIFIIITFSIVTFGLLLPSDDSNTTVNFIKNDEASNDDSSKKPSNAT